jgi:hypothetical protein
MSQSNTEYIKEEALNIPVNKKTEVLVAGQTISMTYMVHEPGRCRGMVPCMHWGQAAGMAAAISLKQSVSPVNVDIPTLRKTLEEQGANLRKDAIDLSEVTENIKQRGATISHIA